MGEIQQSVIRGMGIGMVAATGLVAAAMVGCDTIEKVVGTVAPPGADLREVNLVDHPSARELARWACHNLEIDFSAIGLDIPGLDLDGLRDEFCPNPISKDKLVFSFDVIFDMSNENEKLPIPLVEILLGMRVYDDANLGAMCVKFCDPEEEDCTPKTNAEGTCEIDDAEDVQTAADLIPTVEELTNLAEAVATGDVDNSEFRVIPAQDEIEAHILFDFNIDTMLSLSEHLLMDAAVDILQDEPITFEIPYTVDGTLFFTVPELGRHAIGFGPHERQWDVSG